MLAHRAGRLVARVDAPGGLFVLKADVAAGAFETEVAAIARLTAAGSRSHASWTTAPGDRDAAAVVDAR